MPGRQALLTEIVMQSLASLTNKVEFEACSVKWKGQELHFWCKVLSAREHRQVTDYFSKEGTLDLAKYREMTDAMVSQCVYLDRTEMSNSKRTPVEFVDADGESHELVQWVTKSEAGDLKASLADALKKEIETVNSLKQDDGLGKE
jgi:hypothetical protein